MTKADYIKNHPRSYLAHALVHNDWPDNQPIVVVGGYEAPDNKNSNLYRALQDSQLHDYCVGARRRMFHDGWWIAVA